MVQGISGVSFDQAGGYYSITGGCSSISSLPDLAFVIGGHTYTLPPVQWTQSVRHFRLLANLMLLLPYLLASLGSLPNHIVLIVWWKWRVRTEACDQAK